MSSAPRITGSSVIAWSGPLRADVKFSDGHMEIALKLACFYLLAGSYCLDEAKQYIDGLADLSGFDREFIDDLICDELGEIRADIEYRVKQAIDVNNDPRFLSGTSEHDAYKKQLENGGTA